MVVVAVNLASPEPKTTVHVFDAEKGTNQNILAIPDLKGCEVFFVMDEKKKFRGPSPPLASCHQQAISTQQGHGIEISP